MEWSCLGSFCMQSVTLTVFDRLPFPCPCCFFTSVRGPFNEATTSTPPCVGLHGERGSIDPEGRREDDLSPDRTGTAEEKQSNPSHAHPSREHRSVPGEKLEEQPRKRDSHAPTPCTNDVYAAVCDGCWPAQSQVPTGVIAGVEVMRATGSRSFRDHKTRTQRGKYMKFKRQFQRRKQRIQSQDENNAIHLTPQLLDHYHVIITNNEVEVVPKSKLRGECVGTSAPVLRLTR